MSIQTALVAIKTANAALNALIGTRFHPDILPQGVVLPCVRFQVVTRPKVYTFGVVPQISHPRVQLDGYAATPALRTALATDIRGAFDMYSSSVAIGGHVIQGILILNEWEGVELVNTSIQAFRISMDLRVHIVD